jgi:general secretion pathway protein C
MSIWKERLQEWKNRIGEKSASLRAQLRPTVEKLTERLASWSEQLRLRERFQKLLPQDLTKSLPKTWDWRAMLEWASSAVQRRGAGFYGTLLALALSAFFLADLASLWIESKLPDSQAPQFAGGGFRGASQPREDQFASIWTRNLFSSKGLIPGDATPGDPGLDPGGTPQPTSLPLNLVGTLILRNELKSIATIEDKSASMVYPVRVEDEIPSKIRVLKIEPSRVIFVNIASGRREFVEIPEDAAAGRVTINRAGSGKQTAGIERTGNNFNVPRLDLDRAFSDLNSVLTQARAVPHYENGVPAGYKLFQVIPDGFFAKLGLKDQDIICGIDGQPVNDPAKALELLGSLKTANHVDLCVKRDGRQQQFSYDIR